MNSGLELILRGIGLGFAIAAPVGPIGLLCIRRTLTGGWVSGLLSGLGAASADAFYGSLAAFGLTMVYDRLSGWQVWIQMVGAAFVIALGIQAIRTPPAKMVAPAGARLGLLRTYLSTFLLTLSNPVTILSFLAIFAGLNLVSAGQPWGKGLWLVTGVFLGSSLWWLLLSSGIFFLKRKLNPLWLRGINLAAGAGLVLFGALMIVKRLFFNA